MWIVTLLRFALLVRAAQNYTIDDASPLVTYNAPALQRNHTAFDSRLLWDGTITYVVPTPNFSPTISIPFNGTAIYIFVAYPGLSEPAPSGFTALIDGVPASGVPRGGWAANESALLYHHLVYYIAALPAAPHTLVMQIKPGWELYLDYAIYTSDMDPPPPSISTSSTKKPPLGAIIGAVLGGILLIALATAVCLLRRRRAAAKRRLTPVKFAAGVAFDNEAVEAEEKKDAGPPMTPFLLREAPPARDRLKSAITLPDGDSPRTCVTSDRGLVHLTAEVRHLAASVQRLETGIPEAYDGGQVMQRPPAYGDSLF
ncbi:hypothetical protein GGX14DRAFT_546522 [Mycena pura]|uniref:Uncharacterized protein n=1 Tax=Mycena pura TaxID=153505 RepID=A0AAD6UQ04_9AGAR|nr:hypothetical protein GGX14DRAFT_546522 [Mycena pura]